MYLSNGNRRMNIPTFSLPTSISCPKATSLCLNWCYAKKAERAYKNVLPSRIKNLNDSKRDDFVPKMIDAIKSKECSYIRIHEAGDFYSQEYLEKWFKICQAFLEKKFLAYTQSYHLDYTNKPDNLIIYWTLWPDSTFAFKRAETGLRAIVISSQRKSIGKYPKSFQLSKDIFICKKGKGTGVTCEKCLHCFEGRGDVIFEVH